MTKRQNVCVVSIGHMFHLHLCLFHPLTFSWQTALTITLPSVCTECCCRPRTPTSTLHISPAPLPPPPPLPCPRPPVSPFLPRGRGLAQASANQESSRLSALQGLERSPRPESRPGRFDLRSSMMSSPRFLHFTLVSLFMSHFILFSFQLFSCWYLFTPLAAAQSKAAAVWNVALTRDFT